MARIIILIITSLVVWSTLVVSANDCRVRDKYSPELWNGDSLKLLAFTSDQDGFTCMLNFQRLDNYLFYDQIVLSNTGNKVIRTDHGNIEYLDIHSSLNDTGWNEFIFSIDDNSIFMAKVRDELVLNYTVEYPVKTITTYGSNISLCSNPTWAVGEYEPIVIPLYPRPQGNEGDEVLNPKNSSIYLTLSSTASFNPIIKVDGIKRFLTMKNGEILLSQGLFQPLRLKKYLLEVHTQKQNININCKLGNDSNKLMEFQVATVLSDIEISSQGMSFTVDLDISSILFTSTTTTTPTTITTKTPSALAVDSNDETSTGLVVVIVIAVLALLALVVIIIFYMKRKRSRTQEIHQENTVKGLINSNDVENSLRQTEETSLQDENNSDDGNCTRSANDLETLSGNAEGARSQEVGRTIAKNDKIIINDVEKSFERTEDKSSEYQKDANDGNYTNSTPEIDPLLKHTESKSSQSSAALRSSIMHQLRQRDGSRKSRTNPYNNMEAAMVTIQSSNILNNLGFDDEDREGIMNSYSKEKIKEVLDNIKNADINNQDKTLPPTSDKLLTTIPPSNYISHLPANKHKPLEKFYSCEYQT